MNIYDTREGVRLLMNQQGIAHWNRWGPFVAERAWGTVREDYSANGDAWRYFPYEHSASRTYRWSEDGLLGICADSQRPSFAPAPTPPRRARAVEPQGRDAQGTGIRTERPRGQPRRRRQGLLVLPRQYA